LKGSPLESKSPQKLSLYGGTSCLRSTKGREGYLTRVTLTVGDVDGWIVLDQIRTSVRQPLNLAVVFFSK